MTQPFTLAVLPDTQIYAESYPHIFTAQTQWIADNKDRLNIAFVLHSGDVTNGNAPYHWENARSSMTILEKVVPYAIVIGNHDMGINGDCSVRESLFSRYFPVSSYQSLLTFGNTFESGVMNNCFHLFDTGGVGWLLLTLDYLPGNQVLEWAREILESYPYRRVIVLTHAHVYSDNSLFGSKTDHNWTPEDYGISRSQGGVNSPIQVWENLLRHFSNISLVFNGHFTGNGVSSQDGAARVIGISKGGNRVLQMLANYQHIPEGGSGFMRLAVCNPSEGTVSVSTYSPYLDTYLTDSDNQFTEVGINLGSV